MVNAKHSPGPWRWEDEDRSLDDANGCWFGILCEGADQDEDVSDDLNRRLIAAAPEMLDLLRRLVAAHDNDEAPLDNAIEAARAFLKERIDVEPAREDG